MKTNLLLIGAALFLGIVSCQKQPADYQVIPPLPKDANLVTTQQVSLLLSDVGQTIQTKNGMNAPFTSIESINPINNENGESICYVINYKGGGFIIMSADNRIEPILAFSTTSTFELDITSLNSALIAWVDVVKKGVNDMRASDKPQSTEVAESWTSEAISYGIGIPGNGLPDDDPILPPIPPSRPCTCYTEQVTQLLSSPWHQGVPYNNNAPLVVDGSGQTVRAQAGCVAVAMGQVMAYHKYPNRYNWSSTNDIARLLRDAGDALGTKYGPDASGADAHDISPSLVGQFGYKQADCADYDLTTVINNLKLHRPVILSGGSKGGSWLIPIYENGHAWVCDGYKKLITCNQHNNASDSYVTYLHMNWGWGGYKDAYYRYDTWNPNADKGYAYDYKLHMVYNIIAK